MTLNYSGPNQAISGDCIDLDEMAQWSPVFVCFDAAAPLYPCPSSAVIIIGFTSLRKGHGLSNLPDYNSISLTMAGRLQ